MQRNLDVLSLIESLKIHGSASSPEVVKLILAKYGLATEENIKLASRLFFTETVLKLNEIGLSNKDNIERLIVTTKSSEIESCIQYFQDANLTFKQEHLDLLVKNPDIIGSIADALMYLLRFSLATKKYFDLMFKYASYEVSYIPRALNILKEANLLNDETTELVCKRPHIWTMLYLLPQVKLANKNNVMWMLQSEYTSKDFNSIDKILTQLGPVGMYTQPNLDSIIALAPYADEIIAALKPYEATNYDWWTMVWSADKELTQADFDSIIKTIRQNHSQNTKETDHSFVTFFKPEATKEQSLTSHKETASSQNKI